VGADDDINVYYFVENVLVRAPKDGGGTPTPITEAGALIATYSVLGGNAYWLEEGGGTGLEPAVTATTVVKSAPLKGGAISVVAQFPVSLEEPTEPLIGVTATTLFISSDIGPEVSYLPVGSAVPDGGMLGSVSGIPQAGCDGLVSDVDAVYCDPGDGPVLRIASDGSTTMLGTLLQQGGLGGSPPFVYDDVYVYWPDTLTVGTIMRAPKTGGTGTATVLARDTQPIVLAVDANAVYWSDEGGNIMRLPK
jgi:hypothetical protein